MPPELEQTPEEELELEPEEELEDFFSDDNPEGEPEEAEAAPEPVRIPESVYNPSAGVSFPHQQAPSDDDEDEEDDDDDPTDLVTKRDLRKAINQMATLGSERVTAAINAKQNAEAIREHVRLALLDKGLTLNEEGQKRLELAIAKSPPEELQRFADPQNAALLGNSLATSGFYQVAESRPKVEKQKMTQPQGSATVVTTSRNAPAKIGKNDIAPDQWEAIVEFAKVDAQRNGKDLNKCIRERIDGMKERGNLRLRK